MADQPCAGDAICFRPHPTRAVRCIGGAEPAHTVQHPFCHPDHRNAGVTPAGQHPPLRGGGAKRMTSRTPTYRQRLCAAVLLLLAFTVACRAQPCPTCPDSALQYDKVVRLKSGALLRNVMVAYEEEKGQYQRYAIKRMDGSIVRALPTEVRLIETHARTFWPPAYNPISIVYPCDERQRELQWYYAEVRGWLMYTGKDESVAQVGIDQFAYGPEAALGVRLGQWGVGLGGAWFQARDIDRWPFFLHARYQFSTRCLAPFAYALLGTVFDNQSGVTLSTNGILHPGPKVAGIGVGLDYPIASWLDLSFDLGYRYMQLPTKKTCDCSNEPQVQETVYFNESHGLIGRVGVTF
jgi:hypothetical protein